MASLWVDFKLGEKGFDRSFCGVEVIFVVSFEKKFEGSKKHNLVHVS